MISKIPIPKFLYRLSSPKYFYFWVSRVRLSLTVLCVTLLAYGLVGGLILAPADYQQGDAFRIIYIHVPSAVISMMAYSLMTFCACLICIWRIKLAETIMLSAVPLGAAFTALALITGAIWGKPMWGTYWIWDARLTSELILFFIYCSILMLSQALAQSRRRGLILSIVVLVGAVDLPIIHYSVYWWNTLHQGATVLAFAKPQIAPSMLYPLLSMIFGFISFFTLLLLFRAQSEVLYRERGTSWVREHVRHEHE